MDITPVESCNPATASLVKFGATWNKSILYIHTRPESTRRTAVTGFMGAGLKESQEVYSYSFLGTGAGQNCRSHTVPLLLSL